MKLPIQLDTTLWAKAQERVFSGEAVPVSVFAYTTLLFAQEEIAPSNLTIRHRLICNSTQKAFHQFHSLHKAGYWAEGYSYWQYTKVGLDWYNKRHGLPVDVLEAMERIDASYRALLPCPLPEVGDMGFPQDGPDLVSTPDHFCKRWRNPDGSIRAYLLIALNTDPEPRANLHHHLEAGYFALWTKDSGWLHRCKPYTTFDFKESLTSATLAACLPAGAMPPTWRVKPPKVKCQQGFTWPSITSVTEVVTGYAFKFTWDNGPFSKLWRTILVHLDENKVIVTDGGLFRKSKSREWEV